MHEDIVDGKLGEMWASSFENRNNNVIKGSLYGEQVNNDPIYSQTIGANRKFVGIEKDIGDRKVKMKLSHDGGIQIYGKTINPNDRFIFDVIDDLEDYLDN